MMSMKIEKTKEKKRKQLIVYDHMIADMEANKKLNHTVTELLFKVENSTSYLFLYHKLISKCP